MVSFSATYLPGEPVKTSATKNGWGQEALDLTRASYHQFVFFRQFVHTEDGDNVFQFLITLQDGLNATRGVVVFLTNNQRIQLTAGGIQRVNGRVDTQGCDLTAQYYGCI